MYVLQIRTNKLVLNLNVILKNMCPIHFIILVYLYALCSVCFVLCFVL